ncbi:MAG TPA: RHS repeat-associated core domain-containing protein [Tepidisphaeraceae bacterium]|nr:RHS repeat-associated core domain-containing protein [Tepidisphaeraceae bacterium]
MGGLATDQPLAEELTAEPDSNRVHWLLPDHQGSIRDVVNSAGQSLAHLAYDTYGSITNNPASMPRFTYTGREWDAAAGLYYNRTRYYDPSIGRFFSQDPIAFDGGDTNLYRYVGNNPLNNTDPTGFCAPAISTISTALNPIMPIASGIGTAIGSTVSTASPSLASVWNTASSWAGSAWSNESSGIGTVPSSTFSTTSIATTPPASIRLSDSVWWESQIEVAKRYGVKPEEVQGPWQQRAPSWNFFSSATYGDEVTAVFQKKVQWYGDQQVAMVNQWNQDNPDISRMPVWSQKVVLGAKSGDYSAYFPDVQNHNFWLGRYAGGSASWEETQPHLMKTNGGDLIYPPCTLRRPARSVASTWACRPCLAVA